MGKGARNKKQAAGASSSHQGPPDAGLTPLPDVEANVGTLNRAIKGLLGAVENMSLQLDSVSSHLKGVVIGGKDEASGCEESAAAEPVLTVDSERDIVLEFHDLKQDTNVSEYQEKFLKLRDLMVKMNYGLSEGYLVSSFLGGLKPEINLAIGSRKPETLCHAFNLARIEEIAMEVMKDKLMSLAGNDRYIQVKVHPDYPVKFGALNGEKAITGLATSGIAGSYLDTSVAITSGCEIEEAEPILVNFKTLGYKAVSRFRCPRFRWTFKGAENVCEMRIVEIKAGYDFLLGMDWLMHQFHDKSTLNALAVKSCLTDKPLMIDTSNCMTIRI